ncbi:MAG: molecular chaperone TorD family protein [Dehalococcoidia bacterium]|nr:molecular chaperone TorD family protein [Dehalococcoidia bacterium]
MFVYSLSGLQIQGQQSQAAVEMEDNATTARTGVYQLLARLLAFPDSDAYTAAAAGEWPVRLEEAAKLLPFAMDWGEASLPPGLSQEAFEAEYLRLFDGDGGAPAPIFGGLNDGDRRQRLEEVVRFYDYFGLTTSAEDPRPADHLSTELEFMKFLTYKEASTPSARLQASFRRAQHDFLERQLAWLPGFSAKLVGATPLSFWHWAATTTTAFVTADAAYARAQCA